MFARINGEASRNLHLKPNVEESCFCALFCIYVKERAIFAKTVLYSKVHEQPCWCVIGIPRTIRTHVIGYCTISYCLYVGGRYAQQKVLNSEGPIALQINLTL